MRFSKSTLGLVAVLILTSFFVAWPASAREGSSGHLATDQTGNNISENQNKAREQANALMEQQKQQSQQKLAEMKQKFDQKRSQHRQEICAKIGERTKKRYTSIEERVDKINNRLTQRVERAKAFVTEKNLTVENYEGLLSDIAAKRQAAEAAAAAVKEAATGFDCNGENAKAQAAAIKAKIATFKTAAKAYKTSVKTFLQAVKTAAQAQLQSESVSQNSSQNRGGAQ